MTVLTVAEHRRGELRDVSQELVAAGRALADATGGDLHVAVISGPVEEYADDLNRDGVETIHTVAHGEEFNHDVYTQAVAQLADAVDPTVLLMPNSVNGLDYAPAVASRLGRPLVTDAVGLAYDDELTVTLVFDESRPVTPDVAVPEATADGVTVAAAHEERVDPDDQPRAKTTPVGGPGDGQNADGEGPDTGGRNADRPDTDSGGRSDAGDDLRAGDDTGVDGEVTVTAVGPEGEELRVDLDGDARIGKVVATVIREADVGASTVELTRERGGASVDSDAPAAEFDGQRLHWRPVERPGGDGR